MSRKEMINEELDSHFYAISEFPVPKEHNRLLCLALPGESNYYLESWVAWREDKQDYFYVPYDSPDMKAKPVYKDIWKYATHWRWEGDSKKRLADWMVQ